MKAIGLTGNIGCGKSTVASLLAKYPDVEIIDCDKISKEIILGNKLRHEINYILGVNVFPGGKADLKHIAEIIFKLPQKRKQLEKLIHPLVWATVQEKVRAAKEGTICIVESAIIYETKSESLFSAIIVTTCDQKEQVRRLKENRKMNDADIQARLGQQIPSSEKKRRAQFVIDTDCHLSLLEDRVDRLYREIKQQKGKQ